MKNKFLFILFLITLSVKFHSQDQLITYTPPADSNVKPNPSTIPKIGNCGEISNYTVGHNDDFTVKVKKPTDTEWTDLFEYNTFVNSGRDLSSSTRSSFVTFDYSGTVNIQITCNNFNSIDAQKILIRPQSRNINWTVSGNVIIITLTTPFVSNTNGNTFSDKLSIELKGDRYRNLHIFANSIKNYTEPTGNNVIVYNKINNGTSANIYDKNLDNESKKIIIEEGAIVIVPYFLDDNSYHNNANIRLKDNDEVYIKGGGILKGGIFAEEKENIKIYGRGIIDLTNFPKKYNDDDFNNYASNQGIILRKSKDILLEGLIINDPQSACIFMQECGGLSSDGTDNIRINNMKMFSRALWGDGLHMEGTSNVSINDCFARTSDDAIAIYASKVSDNSSPNRDALNIKVTNSILYADNAHDIAIGWHGNQKLDYGNNIYNLSFDNIDILEQDQNWIDQDGFIHTDYDGAIGIKCGDENKCDNFIFSNIRIEDFTSGSILSVRLMPALVGSAVKDGKYIQNIKFHNLSYNGSGERKIVIQGIDCDRYVNGVHFENLRINNNLITKLSDYALLLTQITSIPVVKPPLYDTNGFDINKFAYNITFEEGNNYSTGLADGSYTIQNMSDINLFLQNSSNNYISTNNGNNRIWSITQIMSAGQSTGHYIIQPFNNQSKILTGKIFDITQPSPYCDGRYLIDDSLNGGTNQQWKIVGDNTNGYKIINAYLKSYLTLSNNINNSNTALLPKDETGNFQKWKINSNILISDISNLKSAKNSKKKIMISPNPTNDLLNISNLNYNLNYKIEITDLNGRLLIKTDVKSDNFTISTKGLTTGGYFINIYLDNKPIFTEKFLKK